MENKQEDVVGILNQLVEINNDRIEGYKRASVETRDADLKSLFASMSSQSQVLRQQLVDEIIRLNGTPSDATTNNGKLYRIWMDVRAALSVNDRKAVLNNCEFGEDAAQDAYQSALKEEDLQQSDVASLVRKQKDELKQSHDKIKTMRDAVSI